MNHLNKTVWITLSCDPNEEQPSEESARGYFLQNSARKSLYRNSRELLLSGASGGNTVKVRLEVFFYKGEKKRIYVCILFPYVF